MHVILHYTNLSWKRLNVKAWEEGGFVLTTLIALMGFSQMFSRFRKKLFCPLPSAASSTSALWWRSFEKCHHRQCCSPGQKHANGREILTFNHKSTQLTALILASAVFCSFYLCVRRIWVQHIWGCCWAVMVVAPRVWVCMWGGGKASRSHRWWWRSGGICQLASSAWFPDWRLVSWPCSVVG